MINLLPPEYASGIRFGRRNAALRKWLLSAFLMIVGLLLIFGGGWLYLDNQAKQLAKETVALEQQLEQQDLTGVKKSAGEISGSIKLINQVLSREVRFSELLQEVGQVLPPGTVLSELNLSNNIAGGVDLRAKTVDHASAARVLANLEDPKNDLFSQMDIVSVNCKTTEAAYKCDAVYRALFTAEARSRFLNVARSGQ